MNPSLPILAAGVDDSALETLRLELVDCDVLHVSDSAGAVRCLRERGHSVAVAVLGRVELGDELEELIVYVKGTFPEVGLALLGPIGERERERLEHLGVSLFLDLPLKPADLSPLLYRASRLTRSRGGRADWLVTVDKGHWVEITVPSREEYVSRVQSLIDLLEQSNLGQDVRDELMLAIDELVRNAIEWGNRYDEMKQVRVSYYCAEDRVVLKVEDEGEGFNVSDVGDPTKDLAQHTAGRADKGKRPGGFGIHLIRNLVDEVIYNDRGNTVVLTKYLDQPDGNGA